MRVFKIMIIGLLALLPFAAFAVEKSADFQEGKDYKLIANVQTASQATSEVSVVEFFSYGCPWCYHLEPDVEAWLAKKPKNVAFSRVPVDFHPEWVLLAKAYYAAKDLGVLDKMTPVIFDAIHKKNEDISNVQALERLFEEQGIDKATFESAFNFSPSIDMQVVKGNQLLNTYRITQVPTFIIAGKYETNTTMVSNDVTKLFKVIDYLVAKEKSQS